MKLLVLGGSKFLSRELAGQALRRGHTVTCACRGTDLIPPGARLVRLDREDDPTLHGLAKETFDAVIDVARRPSFVSRALETLAGKVGHYSLVSSISVYADLATRGQTAASAPTVPALATGQDETDPANYGPNKVACEQLLLQRFPDRALILRAGLIVGPGDPTDRFTYWPARFAADGPVLVPGSPNDPVQVIDVRDLAAWHLDLAEQGRTGTIDAVGPPLDRGRLVHEIAAGLRPQSELTWVDQEFLLQHQVAPWAGPRSLPLWLPLPTYAGLMDFDPEPARSHGLTTRPLTETARDTLAWVRSVGKADTDRLDSGLTKADEKELLRQWHTHPPG